MTNKIRGFEVAKGFEDKDINLPVRATKGSAGYDFEAAEDIVIPSIWDIYGKAKMLGYKIMGQEFLGMDNLTSEYLFYKEMDKIQDIDPGKDLKTFMRLAQVGLGVAEKLMEKGFSEEDIVNSSDDILSMAMTENMDNFFEGIFEQSSLDEMKKASKTFKPVLVSTGVKAYMQDGEYLKVVNRSSNPLKKGLILTNGVGIVDKDYYSNPDNDGHIMAQFLNFSYDPIEIKKGERIFQGIFQPYLVADDDNATGERVGGHGSTSN